MAVDTAVDTIEDAERVRAWLRTSQGR